MDPKQELEITIHKLQVQTTNPRLRLTTEANGVHTSSISCRRSDTASDSGTFGDFLTGKDQSF